MEPRTIKWWLSFVADVFLYVSLLLSILTIPLPFMEISGGGFFIFYGWDTARIWGWIFPHALFFVLFLVTRNSSNVALRVYIFYELLFAISSAAIAPTITLKWFVPLEDNDYLHGIRIGRLSGFFTLLFSYLLGAAAALLQLIAIFQEQGQGQAEPSLFGEFHKRYISGSAGQQSVLGGSYQAGYETVPDPRYQSPPQYRTSQPYQAPPAQAYQVPPQPYQAAPSHQYQSAVQGSISVDAQPAQIIG